MKLEPNMYVRTNEGTIEKLDDENIKMWTISLMYKGEKPIKASHNIIDLIEEGDIVVSLNGANILEYNLMTLSNIDELKDLWNIQKNIKSIVTKEQFEAVKYEIK